MLSQRCKENTHRDTSHVLGDEHTRIHTQKYECTHIYCTSIQIRHTHKPIHTHTHTHTQLPVKMWSISVSALSPKHSSQRSAGSPHRLPDHVHLHLFTRLEDAFIQNYLQCRARGTFLSV